MRKKVIILLSLFCTSIFAQESGQKTIQDQESVRIIYKVRLNDNFEDINSAEANEILLLIGGVLSGFEFELLIHNSGKSIFRKTEPMIEDYSYIDLYRLALGFSGGDEVWYTGKSDAEKLIYKSGLDGPVLLSLNEEVKWEISQETKYIGKYEVIKATTSRRRGNHIEKIEAWFAKELPFSLGPLGYNGLPGLILEMKNERITYTFKELERNDFSIKSPSKIKSMTFKNYYEFLESQVAGIKSRD